MKIPSTIALLFLGSITVFLAACAGGGGSAAPGASSTQPTAATTAAAGQATTGTKSGASPAAQAGTGSGKATGEPITIGLICDRSGPTANVSPYLCEGHEDWLDFVNNAQGGIKGRPMNYSEVDFKYEVPLGVDGYKKLTTREGVRMLVSWATPLTEALTPMAAEDKVLVWNPGGLSASAEGAKFPYIFSGVPVYKSQAMAIMQFVADDWKAQGKTGNPKVVYLFFDNPAGRDPLDLIRARSAELGLDLVDTFAVPVTSVDLTTNMTQVREKNPDYVITHLFGRTPALALQAAEKVGIPREKMIGFVWAISEDEIRVAQQAAEGYRGMQFAAHPNDNPEAYRLLEGYWQSSGKAPNPKSRESLHYARGMAVGNLFVETARLADNPTDGASLKKGAESMKDFTAHGLLAGTTLTAEDHAGARKLRAYQVQGGKLVQIRDWFEGPLP